MKKATSSGKKRCFFNNVSAIDAVLVAVHVLYVNSVLHRLALGDRRLGEILAAAEFLQDARALVFTFELLEGPLDVFTLLDRHDNHCRNYFWLLKFGCMSLRTPSASAAVPEPPARPVPHRGTVPK